MMALQDVPESTVHLKGGGNVRPVRTLADRFGGKSHIIVDDKCYVLVNGSDHRGYSMACHWYPEAVAALKGLPADPAELVIPPRTEVDI